MDPHQFNCILKRFFPHAFFLPCFIDENKWNCFHNFHAGLQWIYVYRFAFSEPIRLTRLLSSKFRLMNNTWAWRAQVVLTECSHIIACHSNELSSGGWWNLFEPNKVFQIEFLSLLSMKLSKAKVSTMNTSVLEFVNGVSF